jgi:transposase-like protein
MSESLATSIDCPGSIDDLPPAETRRWSAQRKAMVVNGVLNGAISLDEACRRYQLSQEEFRSWRDAIEAHGVRALRVTRSQLYRTRPSVAKARLRSDKS